MRIAVPELVFNAYFPAMVAVDLETACAEGIDIELELNGQALATEFRDL